MPWTDLQHAMGDAADLEALLTDFEAGDRPTAVAALNAIFERIVHQGTIYSATAPALAALIARMGPDRADASLGACMRLIGVVRQLGPAIRAARKRGDTGDLAACDRAIADGLPTFLGLRAASDPLLQCYAIELLSWMPDPVPNLASEELDRLDGESNLLLSMSAAVVAGSDASVVDRWNATVLSWLDGEGSRPGAAAMVWALCRGNPMAPGAVPESVYNVLLDLSKGPRWDDWEAIPARETGFFADLATHLLLSGYHRAHTSLPALFALLDVCAPHEVNAISGRAIKLIYQSAPYPGAPDPAALTPLQREGLARLARTPAVWRDPADLAIALSQLDLPLDELGLLDFLGESADGVVPSAVRVTAVDGDVVTLKTDLTPHELVHRS